MDPTPEFAVKIVYATPVDEQSLKKRPIDEVSSPIIESPKKVKSTPEEVPNDMKEASQSGSE